MGQYFNWFNLFVLLLAYPKGYVKLPAQQQFSDGMCLSLPFEMAPYCEMYHSQNVVTPSLTDTLGL